MGLASGSMGRGGGLPSCGFGVWFGPVGGVGVRVWRLGRHL